MFARQQGGENVRGKMVQIYEAMADITLSLLNKEKEAETSISDDTRNMVSATLQLYNAIADDRQPNELFPQ